MTTTLVCSCKPYMSDIDGNFDSPADKCKWAAHMLVIISYSIKKNSDSL